MKYFKDNGPTSPVSNLGEKELDRPGKGIYSQAAVDRQSIRAVERNCNLDINPFCDLPWSIMYLIYNALLLLSAVFLLPYYALKILLTGKYRKSIGPKFGFNPGSIYEGMTGGPRIWIHAVSVGEVTAAAPIVASLRDRFPKACIVLSTSTETGQEMARKIVPGVTSFMYYPLDLPWVVKKVIAQVRPDLFVIVETELWPNFIRACKALNAQIVIANGRLSPRSFKRYRATRFFWRRVLGLIDKGGVISETDAQRYKAIGLPSSKVTVLGNAKFDGLAARTDPGLIGEIAVKLGVKPGEPVFVAGSTHEGEEAIILEVYNRLLERYPDFKLIIIPRHIERGQEVLALARGAGFSEAITMTEIRKGRDPSAATVIIIDLIGELFKIYGLATVVYCGGSLVPRGGQNILEPAAWGKVVFFGPSMSDFLDEKDLLEHIGVGITIHDGEELFRGIVGLLNDPQALAQKGEAGKQIVAANMGASKRYAALISEHIHP
jgi:3-deoxy-D-manno-octulosonic-acid transferase